MRADGIRHRPWSLLVGCAAGWAVQAFKVVRFVQSQRPRIERVAKPILNDAGRGTDPDPGPEGTNGVNVTPVRPLAFVTSVEPPSSDSELNTPSSSSSIAPSKSGDWAKNNTPVIWPPEVVKTLLSNVHDAALRSMGSGPSSLPNPAGAVSRITSEAAPVLLSDRPSISPVTVPGVVPVVLLNENVKSKLPARAGAAKAIMKPPNATHTMDVNEIRIFFLFRCKPQRASK